jgi:hypothetical protein
MLFLCTEISDDMHFDLVAASTVWEVNASLPLVWWRLETRSYGDAKRCSGHGHTVLDQEARAHKQLSTELETQAFAVVSCGVVC